MQTRKKSFSPTPETENAKVEENLSNPATRESGDEQEGRRHDFRKTQITDYLQLCIMMWQLRRRAEGEEFRTALPWRWQVDTCGCRPHGVANVTARCFSRNARVCVWLLLLRSCSGQTGNLCNTITPNIVALRPGFGSSCSFWPPLNIQCVIWAVTRLELI